jgi:hypothetical protein
MLKDFADKTLIVLKGQDLLKKSLLEIWRLLNIKIADHTLCFKVGITKYQKSLVFLASLLIDLNYLVSGITLFAMLAFWNPY